MVRCLLVDDGLSPNRWDKRALTAAYLCNGVPDLAIQMEKPDKVLYGKDAELSHLKVTKARAFVHIKDPIELGHTSWKGMGVRF